MKDNLAEVTYIGSDSVLALSGMTWCKKIKSLSSPASVLGLNMFC